MSQTFSAAPARHVTKALVCMVGQTSESNTAAQRLAASRAPQATTRLRPGSDTGGSVANGIKQQQRLWRQMASTWEDSWGLSGSFSCLKHEVYSAEPFSRKAEAPAAGWGGQRHGAGVDQTQNERETTWMFGGRWWRACQTGHCWADCCICACRLALVCRYLPFPSSKRRFSSSVSVSSCGTGRGFPSLLRDT